jgi:hypothetical protein
MTWPERSRGEKFHAAAFTGHDSEGDVALNRVAWTDEHIDDAMGRIDSGFESLRDEMREMRTELRDEMREMRTDLQGRLSAGQQQMATIGWGIAAALFAQLIAFVTAQS